MRSVADDIARFLQTGGIGTIGGISDWSIHVNYLPEEPIKAIAIYDTGQEPPRYSVDTAVEAFEFAYIQIRVKSSSQTLGNTKTQDILDYLDNRGKFTIDDTEYHNIFRVQGPFNGEKTEDGFFIRYINFRIPRQKTTS